MEKKIQILPGDTIDQAVEQLLKFKEEGILASCEFNGVMLYSDTVTFDDAYLKITGQTREEFFKEQQEELIKIEKARKNFLRAIPELEKYWNKKGREVLKEDKWELWSQIVPLCLHGIYRGVDLKVAFEIIKILESGGTFEEAKQKLDPKNHSGRSLPLICNLVKMFSQRGEEFFNYIREKC